jgi:hypothetical protein
MGLESPDRDDCSIVAVGSFELGLKCAVSGGVCTCPRTCAQIQAKLVFWFSSPSQLQGFFPSKEVFPAPVRGQSISALVAR